MHYWMNFSKIDQKYQAVVVVAALGVLFKDYKQNKSVQFNFVIRYYVLCVSANLGYMLLRELHDRKKLRALHLFTDLVLQLVPVALITEDSGAASPFVIMGWVAVPSKTHGCLTSCLSVYTSPLAIGIN